MDITDRVRLRGDASGTLFEVVSRDGSNMVTVESLPGYNPFGIIVVPEADLISDEAYQRLYPVPTSLSPVEWRRAALEVGNV